MNKVIDLLFKKKLTISSVESFTAGGFASELASISNISKCFKGSLVCYQTEIKENVLMISKSLIQQHGVISPEIAKEMALKGKEMFDSDLCVSFTGNAGPGAMEDKKVGCVFMAVYYNGNTSVYHREYEGDRNSVKKQSICEIFKILYDILK